VPLVRGWGGVSLIYRKRLQDSPAYRLNHEEVQKALEEGIDFVECMNPTEAVPDEYNAVKAIIFERLEYIAETGKFENTGEMHEFPAHTVCVAAGTSRDYERKDTRDEASKAMADLKAKGMQVNELSPAEASRMRNKLTQVYTQIGNEVGMDLWNETQAELVKIRAQK